MSNPGTSRNANEELSKENAELKRKVAALEARAAAEPKQKAPKIFEDFKLDDESFVDSAYRRLTYHAKNKSIINVVNTTLTNIVDESRDLVPDNVLEMFENLRGIDWPETMGKPCIPFNTRACENKFIHEQAGSKNHMCLHICAICVAMHKVLSLPKSYIQDPVLISTV